jgi:hypothetical protein
VRFRASRTRGSNPVPMEFILLALVIVVGGALLFAFRRRGRNV